MLENILKMLSLHKAYNVSKEVEITKGKYAIPVTVKDMWIKLVREIKFKK